MSKSKKKKKKMMNNSENRPFLFNPFPKHIIVFFGQRYVYFDDINPLHVLNLRFTSHEVL